MSCKKELRVILVKKKGRFLRKNRQCFCFFTKNGGREGRFRLKKQSIQVRGIPLRRNPGRTRE